MVKKLNLFLFLFTQLSFSQLSNFTLTVTKTDESCNANGTLSFVVNNTTPGATIIYNVYKLPNITTPIATLSTPTFSGLSAGNYTVIATQSMGTLSNTQQQNVIILNQIVPLTYQIVSENVICGNDGKITVNIGTGAAVSYELFAGPMIRPLQNSNVFSNLTTGQYSVRVFDTCGEGVVQIINIIALTPDIEIKHSSYDPDTILNCTENLQVIDQISNQVGGIIYYPLTLNYIVTTPTGLIINIIHTISSGNQNFIPLFYNIPLFYDQIYSYKISVTDGCGNIFYNSERTIHPKMEAIIGASRINCTENSLNIKLNEYGTPPFTINFLSAPIGFNPLVYNSSHPTSLTNLIGYYNPSVPLPQGNYVVEVTDACGKVSTNSTNLLFSPSPQHYVYYDYLPGCQLNQASCIVFLYNSEDFIGFQSAEIISAPTGYPFGLPHNVSNQVTNSALYLNDLISGSYIIKTIDLCGTIQYSSFDIVGYTEFVNNINIIEHCNSFDINLNNLSNVINPVFWLQKRDINTNQWVNPINNNSSTTNNPDIVNAIQLNNSAINYNFSATGNFRIIKQFNQYSIINPACYQEIYTFDFSNQPKFNHIYTFSCNDGTYDVIIDAAATPPLIFRITQKNGQPFVVQNGNSPVFLGLTPANYNFQVEDSCGNILNGQFDIPNPYVFGISSTPFCNGSSGSLSLPNFSFLQYEWWKDNNTSTILSTTNLLQFSPFNTTSNTGIYHVRVKYLANPSSCINSVLDYTITGAGNSANSGIGTTTNFCGSQGNIDLFTLILGNYDIGGTWTETSSSGTLSGNIWNATGIISGNYQFKYKVTAPCGTTAESVYNVSVNSIPQTPVAFSNPIVCNGQSLNLLATTIANATYSWTGPNSFTANVQNPTINSVSAANDGIYTVKATVNGCDSGSSSVTVGMGLLPQFTITTACSSNKITAKASPILSTFDPNTAVYNWTGPNGFTATGNPAILTNGKGQYYLTITNNFGCATTNPIFILYTLCEIPKGVSANNDGDNDTFDLSGFGTINNLKIFNRYGVLLNQFENYTNQWHGQDFNENKLQDGTYYYYIKLNSGEEKTGWVYLTN